MGADIVIIIILEVHDVLSLVSICGVVSNSVLAVSVTHVILEGGADIEFIETNGLLEGLDRVLGGLLHEESISRHLSFINTKVASKINTIESLNLLCEKLRLVVGFLEIIVDEIVIVIHMSHDLFVSHVAKTLETGVGK